MWMMLCKPILVLALFAIAAVTPLHAAGGDSYITKSGKAHCVIVMPNDATPGEARAAVELSNHIKQITGVELSQIPESQYSPAKPCISIGRTKMSRKYVTDAQVKALGDDGYTVFCKGKNCFFVGGRKRGSMYAVYEFLESLGVRWYSPDYTVIPKIADVKMPAKSFEFKPSFWYRDQWWNNGTTPEWLARMRVNGNNGQNPRLPEAMGGSVVTIHGCHSYAILVPSDNFATHPQWFALKENGTRSGSELCLTNPELREFVTQRVLTDLKAASGKIDNYWVSQNDGGGSGCFCERCTEERLAHGGKDRWSANTISFTSAVADKVKQDYPNTRIKTLAYNYTQAAPENMSASDNVLVEICGNFKLGDSTHADLVQSWSKVAKNISVYTYGGSNYGYWWPYPNVWEVGMQYPWAKASGVRAFYVQGTALGHGAGLVDMRAYISARLAWDPTRDVNKEIRDFCEGFYGPGGKYIVEYLDWYTDYVKQHKMVMNANSVWGDAEAWRHWVTKDAMEHCDGLFQSAIAATKSNPTYVNHVRRAYLEVLWGRIMIDLKPGSQLSDKDLALQPGADPNAVAQRAKLFGEIMRENGYNRWSEVVTFDPSTYPH
jgi:hypothetical protein